MIIVTGTYPPEKCGVADYTERLLQTATAKEKSWKLVHTQHPKLSQVMGYLREVKSYADPVVNLQYPSRGYGKSLFPHLFSLAVRLFSKKKLVITVHEYSQLSWKSTVCSYLLLWCAHQLIFTNPFEQAAAIKRVPSVAKKSSIIKIYSNISSAEKIKPITQRQYEIGYFGYIRPMKGIEEYISTIQQLKETGLSFRAYILGDIFPDTVEYANEMLEKAKKAGIEIFSGRPDAEVATILADTKIAFLPYPDGLSERRGSFLACIKNQTLVVSTLGPFVTPEQKESFILLPVQEAGEALKQLLAMPDKELIPLQEKVLHFTQTQLPQSWDEVAQIYEREVL